MSDAENGENWLIREAQERRGKTYHGHAGHDLGDMVGGRYGKLPKATVTGTEPIPRMPEQPAGSPWRCDECPPEPAIDRSREDGDVLGYEIDRPDGSVDPSLTSSVGSAELTPPDWQGRVATGIRLRRRI